ncbi:hypothetical protein OG413_42835 [Streptomyces sp. NBC_01433]|nr:hypothetical protein [Streptomyces sp. NBC_01433]MCX4681937.1 hypothetical protein [Streptomyces sp. NBC_01433]
MRHPLTPRTTAGACSNTPYPLWIDGVPHCANKREWADMMHALYES